MSRVSVLLVLCALIVSVLGHAVLIKPGPYNTNPSKTGPCGITPGPLPSFISQATWIEGQTVPLVWQLIASDGGGAVTASVDETGGTTFSKSLGWSFDTSALGTYPEAFTVPTGISCAASPDGLCTVQFTTASGWYSCTRVNFTVCDGCPTPPPNPPTPVEANNLVFCTDRNKQTVLVPAGTSPNTIDVQASVAYHAYLNTSTVFSTPTNPNCPSTYKLFLCNLELPTNPGSGQQYSSKSACQGDCYKAMQACGLTSIHTDLYNCSGLPLCSYQNAGNHVIIPFAAFLVILLALLF